jgi:PKD repeat protein
VATTTAVILVIVAIGLASLRPKAEPEAVNSLPDALFSFEKDQLQVVVNATESVDPDGTIANYSWKFGDGTEGFGVVAEHTFAANGTYTISLNLTDNKGGTNSTSKDVTVALTIEPGMKDPIAVFEIVSSENGVVVLDASESNDPDGGDIVTYSWDFGDGTFGTGAGVSHTFAANGTYTITLTVTDDEDATNSTSEDVTVTIESPPPEKIGPPGLYNAIEIHQDMVQDKPQLQNSLDHLVQNLQKWIQKHAP